MGSFWSDLRHALRQLRRSPGFTAAAVLTLGLGIGATTAIFSVVQGVLLEPLPFENPESLVTMDQVQVENDVPMSLSIPNFRDWRDRNRVFERVAAAAPHALILSGRGPARVVQGRAILGEFFETLGVAPHRGRLIPGEETEPGADRVVVLAHGFWERELGGDPGILGEGLVLDGRVYTVAGILPPRWGWPNPEQDVYLPMGTVPGLPWDGRDQAFGARAIARLLPGTALETAQSDLDRIGREIQDEDPQGAVAAEVRPFQDYFVGDARAGLWALLAGVGLLLLVAVVNVTNLLLVRGEDRHSELAVRTALGAGRGRILRQLLAESLVLSAAGGALGIGLAWVAVAVLLPSLPNTVPQFLLGRVRIDAGVLGFSAGLAAVASLLAGLVPAVRASRAAPVTEMRGRGGASSRGGRLRHAFVAMQVATTLVLLLGAGLLVRSSGALRAVDKGFDADGVLTARLSLPDQYRDEESRWTGLYRQLLSDLSAVPGVETASASLLIPLDGRSWETRAAPEGEPLNGSPPHSHLFNIVSDDHFSTLRIPILEGRGFNAEDRRDGTPVTVVDERMAELFWPGESAIGKRVFLGEFAPESTHEQPIPMYRTVIGVAGHVRHYQVAEPSLIQSYTPYEQRFRGRGQELGILLRTAGPPESLAPSLRRVVGDLAPDVALRNVRSLESYVSDDLGATRAMGRLFALFGGLALALAGVGIFGVVAYAVRRQTRELGIRMAMGADARRILVLVLRGTMGASGIGVAIGLATALVVTRLLEGLLFGVSPFDPPTYALLTLFLLTVAAGAASLPALRATRVDPTEVLRHE